MLKLRNLFATVAICLLLAVVASAASITFAAHTIAAGSTYPGSTCELRIWASQTFTANDGTTVMGGAPGSGAFYKSVPCTISAGVITISAFTIYATTDAIDNQLVTYTAIFYDSKGVKRDTFFSNFRVPISLGNSITWAQLRLHMAGQQPWRDTNVYTRTQVDLLVSQVAGVNSKATTTTEGINKVSVAPVDAAHPIAVETGDPRVPTQAENDALAGTAGSPSSANKYVTSSDGRLSGALGNLLTGNKIQAANYVFSTTSSTAVSVAGVKDPVDRELTYAVTAPGGSIPTTGGVIIFFTYTNASGETLPSNIRGIGVGNGGNSQITVTSPPAVANATGWNLYAGQGALSSARKQNSSPIAIGTGQTLTTISSSGATKPTANTTGGSATVTVASGTSLSAPVEADTTSTAKVYQAVLIDGGTGQEETVYILAKPTASSFTASFSKTHSVGFTVTSATGGIQEAIMSWPAFPPLQGGTVVVPPYTLIKAPVILRQGTILMGEAAGNAFDPSIGAMIDFASTDAGIGAVMTLRTGSGVDAELHNLTVRSATNAVYAQGILGDLAGFIVDHCNLNGNLSGTNHNTSGLRSSYGSGYIRITNSVIAGAPAVALRGAFLNNAVFENILIGMRIDGGDLSYKGEGFTVVASGGGPVGPAGGGFIRMKNVVTENGNGAPLNLQDVNFDIEQFDVADPSFDTPVSQFKYKITAGYAISTLRLSRVQFAGNAPVGAATISISKDDSLQAFTSVPTVKLEDVQFDPNNVAIDGGSVTGPFFVTRSKGFNVLAASGAGSVVNRPSDGIITEKNYPVGSNEPDGVVHDGSTSGRKVYGVAVGAPATPPSGQVVIYSDVADKTFKAKDDAGIIKVVVKPATGAANQFATGISTDGVLSFAAISGVEQLLQSTTSVNMNTGTATSLYPCASNRCVITKIVISNVSLSLTTASYSYGWSSPAFADVIDNATHTELGSSLQYTVLYPKVGAKLGLSGDTFKVLMNTLQGAAATARMDVFGYTY